MLAVALPGSGRYITGNTGKYLLYMQDLVDWAMSCFYTKWYNTYIKAYQDFTDKVPETDSYTKFIKIPPDEYDPVLHPETYSPSTASWV